MSSTSSDRQREPTEVLYRGCMTAGGAVFALVCAGLAAWAVALLILEGFSLLNLAIALFFGLFALLGAVLSYRGFKYRSDRASTGPRRGSRRRTVLRVARKMGGRLTLGELTLHTRLEPDEAQKILDDLEMHRIAELQLTESGREVYVFPTFADDEADKKTARSLTDGRDEEVELLLDELDELEEREEREEREAQRVSAGRSSASDDEAADPPRD